MFLLYIVVISDTLYEEITVNIKRICKWDNNTNPYVLQHFTESVFTIVVISDTLYEEITVNIKRICKWDNDTRVNIFTEYVLLKILLFGNLDGVIGSCSYKMGDYEWTVSSSKGKNLRIKHQQQL